MTVQSLTLSIPELLYEQIKNRAAERDRSVEDETLELLANAVPGIQELPKDLAAAIAPLELLDNEALVRAAQSHLPPDVAQILESLHLKRQREGLTAAERETLSALVLQYERAMLVRAQAARLLRERGLDVADPSGSPGFGALCLQSRPAN
jgi:plasmid stability protein